MRKEADEHKKKKHLLIMLAVIVLFLFNIITDGVLTEKALSTGDYYETNRFTARTSAFLHACLLCGLVLAACLVIRHYESYIIGIISFGLFTLIWTVNNIWSKILLG